MSLSMLFWSLQSETAKPRVFSSSADLETLDMELGAQLEGLGVPMGLEAELVRAVSAP